VNKLAVVWRNDSARFVSLKNNRNESFIHNAPSSLRFLIKRVKNVLLMSSLRSRINSLERWPRSDLLLKTLLTRSKVQVLFIRRSNPRITDKSKRLSRNTPIDNLLYNDALRRQERAREMSALSGTVGKQERHLNLNN